MRYYLSIKKETYTATAYMTTENRDGVGESNNGHLSQTAWKTRYIILFKWRPRKHTPQRQNACKWFPGLEVERRDSQWPEARL